MHWDFYTTYAIASGALLILLSLVAREPRSYRAAGALAGAFFAGYGLYVASRHTGTYYFPVAMLVLPVIAVMRLGSSLLQRLGTGSALERTAAIAQRRR